MGSTAFSKAVIDELPFKTRHDESKMHMIRGEYRILKKARLADKYRQGVKMTMSEFKPKRGQ